MHQHSLFGEYQYEANAHGNRRSTLDEVIGPKMGKIQYWLSYPDAIKQTLERKGKNKKIRYM